MRAARRGRAMRLALGAGSLLLAACSGGTGPPTAGSPTASAGSGSPVPAVAPPSTSPAALSPLSGRPAGAGRPVLVVKVDNTPNAQPQSGLTAADLVYVEEVEYGLTRLAAVFSSTLPSRVGPVRSARISDVDLLAQLGRPAFAYSGAQHRLRPVLARASLYDVSGDRGPAGYYRDPRRPAPYNFFGVPSELLARAPRATPARSIGFVFSPTPPPGGRSVRTATVRYPSSTVQFAWDAASSSWAVRFDGRPARATEGGTQHATTVVLQLVRQRDSGYGDKFGGRTPLLVTVGSGTAWVLRDGRAYPATWSRPVAAAGTTFTSADGSTVPFAAGQVWVALVGTGRTVAFS